MFDNEIVFGVTVLEAILAAHVITVVVGAGAAFFSDFMFNSHMKDRIINTDEFDSLSLASKITWVSLLGIVITGLLVFLSDPELYLDSVKFQAKMSIIAAIIVNGLIFESNGIPIMKKYRNKKLDNSKKFYRESHALFVGGAVSAVSWTAAIVLGSLSFVQASYGQIMGVYLIVLAVAVASAEFIHDRYLRGQQKPTKKS